MTGRPEDGYRVAARIEGRSSRRGRFLAVVLGISVVGWAGVTLSDRLGDGGPQRSGGLASGDTGRATGPPSLGPGQTFPPPVEVRQASAPLGQVPVVLDGLAWVDLKRGATTRRTRQDLIQWRFALADGAACVCLDPGLDANTAMLHVDRYDRTGFLVATRSERWLDADQGLGLVDAILDPVSPEAIVASVVQSIHGWSLRMQRIPFEAFEPVQSALSPLAGADLGDSAQVSIRLTSAPDGSVLRVDLTRLADDPSTEWHGAWLVPVVKGRFGRVRAAPAAPSDVPFTQCQGQAWATPTIFAELCQIPRDDGRVDSFARLQDLKGSAWDIALGPDRADEPGGWLVDGAHGLIYAWTSYTHGLFRIDAATRALKVRVLSTVDSNGTPRTPTVTPEPAPTPEPGASPGESPAESPAAWQPTNGAGGETATSLVGSPDGRLLYAAGRSYGIDGAPPSTGIWVFDAASFAIVDHWAAAVTFEAIGLDPAGRYLIGTGEPSAEEVAAFGNHGAELAVLDRADGSVVVILRALGLHFGGVPLLLPAPSASVLIGEFTR